MSIELKANAFKGDFIIKWSRPLFQLFFTFFSALFYLAQKMDILVGPDAFGLRRCRSQIVSTNCPGYSVTDPKGFN